MHTVRTVITAIMLSAIALTFAASAIAEDEVLHVVLTVSQSKRLIAKGVWAHPDVRAARQDGLIAVYRGSTGTAIAEEFLGEDIESFAYTIGITLPEGDRPESPPTFPDLVIEDGSPQASMNTQQAVDRMTAGDVIIKGANALNYDEGIAGGMIGSPVGGSVGGFWGKVYGAKLKLVIPVGLEKEIAGDIATAARESLDGNPGPSLVPMYGIIITELEAVELLSGAKATQIAAGGVRGAEGAVRLLIRGTPDQIDVMKEILAEVQKEKAF
jgi:hypothetical protein